MEKHHKFSIWYILLGVWVILIIQNWIASMYSVDVIPYSRFPNLAQAKPDGFQAWVVMMNGSRSSGFWISCRRDRWK